MKRFALSSLLLLSLASVSAAQWQVPTNTIPIGRGVGTGFSSTGASATSNLCLRDTVPPSFGNCGREKLTTTKNVFVNCSTGNNSNLGTALSPWLTIQHAIDTTKATLDLAGQTLQINVADGTCSGTTLIAVSGLWTGQTRASEVVFIGNITTPANVVLSGSGNTVVVSESGKINIKGFKITSSGGVGIDANQWSWVSFERMDFGSTSLAQIAASKGGITFDNGNITISAGASSHCAATDRGVCFLTTGTTTLSGTPAFSAGFVNSESGGNVTSHTKTFAGTAASAGTKQFIAARGSQIATGVTFPGGTAGETDESSIYWNTVTGWSGSFPIRRAITATEWAMFNAANKILLEVVNTASAVNGLDIVPSATTNRVAVRAIGDDTNIGFDLRGKGTGGVAIQGTSASPTVNATAGDVGEFVESVIQSASATNLSTGVAKNVTTISLSAGDWDVRGTVHLKAAATTNIAIADASVGTLDAALSVGTGTYASLSGGSGGLVPNVTSNPSLHMVPTRVHVTGTTTVYLVIQANFSVSTLDAFGQISARRKR